MFGCHCHRWNLKNVGRISWCSGIELPWESRKENIAASQIVDDMKADKTGCYHRAGTDNGEIAALKQIFLFRHHLNRFGTYELHFDRVPQPITEELKF